MSRLAYYGPEQHSVVEMLRREFPKVAVGDTLSQLPALLVGRPDVLVTTQIDHLAELIDQTPPSLPIVVVSEAALESTQRSHLLDLLDERGTLLAPVDPTSLRATLRSWSQPSPDPALLDSAALARVYAAGGRRLADHVVTGFLLAAPGLAQRAEEAFRTQQHELCVTSLEELAQQAGSVGASDVCDAVEEILEELIEGGHVEESQWQVLERSLASTVRVLGEQKKQDRTV